MLSLSSSLCSLVLYRDRIPDQNSNQRPFTSFLFSVFESFCFAVFHPRHGSRRSLFRHSPLRVSVGIRQDRRECCESAGRSPVKFSGRYEVQPAGHGSLQPTGRGSLKLLKSANPIPLTQARRPARQSSSPAVHLSSPPAASNQSPPAAHQSSSLATTKTSLKPAG